MNTHRDLLWIIGLGISSLLSASEAPQANRREQTANDRSATASVGAWDTTAREAAPAIPAKLLRYAQQLVKRFDRNGSGALETSEWASMPGNPSKIDRNRDGVITVEELAEYLANYARLHPLQDKETAWQHLPRPPALIFQPATPAGGLREKSATESTGTPAPRDGEPAAGKAPSAEQKSLEEKRRKEGARAARKYYVALPPGLPDWFYDRDTDGDGQLTLAEFAPDGSSAQRRLFAQYDMNGDGVITPDEVLRLAGTSPEKEKPSTEAKTSPEKKTPSSSDRK
jgi:hypothetical protein